MIFRYILIGQTPVPEPDYDEWVKWSSDHDRDRDPGTCVVAQTEIGDLEVYTVFRGIDLRSVEEGPPILFETMVFGSGDKPAYHKGCSTWLEAEAQHAEALALVEKYQKEKERNRG